MRSIRRKVIVGTVLCLAGAVGVHRAASSTAPGPPLAAPVTSASALDPGIRAMVQEIDAGNIERTIRTLAGFGTRSTFSVANDSTRGVGAARDWLYQQFLQLQAASGGRLRVELQSFDSPSGPSSTPVRITNVIATLPGAVPTAAGRVYVVSGHYDSRCSNVMNGTSDAPGADDDASGVAAVLEMARAMAPRQFPATLVFMAVSGEEPGLLGSSYFAAQARQQQMDIEGMFTNDIIGATWGGNGVQDSHSVRLFCAGGRATSPADDVNTALAPGADNDSPSCQLARFIKEAGEQAVPGFTVNLIYRLDRFGRGGDQIPFVQRGYPAVRFTEPNEDLRHQHQDVRTQNRILYGDLPEFVDFTYAAQVARVNAAALAALATAPPAPKGVTLSAGGAGNDALLRWDPVPDPAVAGYEVVWRSSTEPLWTHAAAVGPVDQYRASGLAPSGYLFGVRAVDGQGHHSPVGFAGSLPVGQPPAGPGG